MTADRAAYGGIGGQVKSKQGPPFELIPQHKRTTVLTQQAYSLICLRGASGISLWWELRWDQNGWAVNRSFGFRVRSVVTPRYTYHSGLISSILPLSPSLPQRRFRRRRCARYCPLSPVNPDSLTLLLLSCVLWSHASLPRRARGKIMSF